MSSKNIAIQVKNLCKKYTIGGPQEHYTSLRDVIVNSVKAPFKRFTPARPVEEFWALKDVSFDIEQGDVVGIIGRNGAGKSTLLKILSRITTPTVGTVELHGRVGSLLEVGTGFHPEMTGRENIFLNGSILGMKKIEIEQKFDEIVRFAEIDKFLDTPVKRYSSGMYVRLAFSVAAHLEPEILMVDEVLAVGDVGFQKKCLGKMGEVANEGRTVLFVSHNMNAIEELCKSCILLETGTLKMSSPDVKSIVQSYLFGNSKQKLISEWINSGTEFNNPYFKPLHIFISDEYGNIIQNSCSNSEKIFLIIKGNIQISDPALIIGYAIFSEDGIPLYWSFHADTKEETWPKLHLGVNHVKSQIPPRFLNQGTYRIELISLLHYRQYLCQPGVNTPSIFFTIQGGLSDSPYWMNKRPGLLAPVIEWESFNPPSS